MKISKAGMDEGFLENSNCFEALIHGNFCGVLAFDMEFRYRLWSPVMELISGMRAHEVMGHNAFDLFPFLRRTNESALFQEVVEGRVAQSREIPFDVPTTGRRGYFDGNYQPLFDNKGEVVGGLTTIRDVTAEVLQKRFAAMLDKESESELEHEFVTIAAGQLTWSLGQVILQRRKTMGLSQEELAHRAELHRTYICDIERGERNIAVKNMARIAQALAVPVWVLLGWAETYTGDRDR